MRWPRRVASECSKTLQRRQGRSNRPGRASRQSKAGRHGGGLAADRLGRSIKDLIYLVEQLEDAGVGLKRLQENIDTTSTGGRLVFHLFAALAEFERNLISECTHARLSAARARGRLGGRKKRLIPPSAKSP